MSVNKDNTNQNEPDKGPGRNKPKRPRLADLLGDRGKDDLANAWAVTPAAPAFAVLPRGRYLLEAVAAKLELSRNRNPAYSVRFRVVAPGTPHHGQLVFHRFWLTDAALSMSKAGLEALGILRPDQMEEPLPRGLRVEADVALHTRDDGTEYNEVRNFKPAEPAPADPFAPDAATARKLAQGDENVAVATPATDPQPAEQPDAARPVPAAAETTAADLPQEEPVVEPPARKRRARKPADGPSLYPEDGPADDGPYQGERP